MALTEKQLRDSLADTAVAINKGSNKVAKTLSDIQAEKEKGKAEYQKSKKASQEAILKGIKGVEEAVKNQEVAETVTIKNPEAITGDLKAGLEGIINTLKEELKNFDKNIVVKNDFSNFASLFKSSQDKKSIIEALKKIEDKLDKPEKEEREQTDYTLILSDIAKALETDEALPILKEILAKEYNVTFPGIMDVNLDPSLIENKRVKVILRDDQVAKIVTASANNGPLIENANSGDNKTQMVDSSGNNISTKIDSLATSAKQDDIITAVSSSTDIEGLGNISVGLTEVEIVVTGTPKTIRLRADTNNTGIIFIGKTGVLSDGTNDFVRLESGDELIMNYNDTKNALYAISDTASQLINVGVIL